MALDLGIAIDLTIAVALVATALALLLFGSRRTPEVVLSFFLVLVGLNFLFNGLARPFRIPNAIALGFVTLALDPFFLLLFASIFPADRRDNRIRSLLALLGALALVNIAWLVVDPSAYTSRYQGTLPGARPPPGFVLLVAGLVLGYAGAWFVSVEQLVRAPTPELNRQASWLAVAVGVATVPRLGLVSRDLDWVVLFGWTGAMRAHLLADTLFIAPLAACFFAAAWIFARGTAAEEWPRVRRPLVTVASLSAGLIAVVLGSQAVGAFAHADIGTGIMFGLRWLVFTAVLAYGILGNDLAHVRAADTRVLPRLAAIVGATFVGLISLVAATGAGVPGGPASAMGVGLAIAVLVPTDRAAHRAIEHWGPAPSHRLADTRRLELYRAALEEAWASGPPGGPARRSLHVQRRELRITPGEARALEHVVMMDVGTTATPEHGRAEPLPGYLVEAVLGETPRTRVMLVRHAVDGSCKVVKQIHHDHRTTREDRRRLAAEVRALGRVRSPNVMRLEDVRVTPDGVVLVHPHIEGTTLEEVLRGPGNRHAIALSVAQQVGRALAAVHGAGVVHRDVKPSNILVAADGQILLFDFDVAATSDDVMRTARPGRLPHSEDGAVGTIAYMSPEQARGEPATTASDVYALGLLLFETLTRRPALDVRGLRAGDALSVARDPHIDLDAVPRSWRSVVASMLLHDPHQRPRDGTAAVDLVAHASAAHGW